MIRTQFSSKIKTLRTNNSMEYKQSFFTQFFLSQNGTIIQDLALESHLKMGVQKENRDIFWIQLELF